MFKFLNVVNILIFSDIFDLQIHQVRIDQPKKRVNRQFRDTGDDQSPQVVHFFVHRGRSYKGFKYLI